MLTASLSLSDLFRFGSFPYKTCMHVVNGMYLATSARMENLHAS